MKKVTTLGKLLTKQMNFVHRLHGTSDKDLKFVWSRKKTEILKYHGKIDWFKSFNASLKCLIMKRSRCAANKILLNKIERVR